jgi:hypothetical protein
MGDPLQRRVPPGFGSRATSRLVGRAIRRAAFRLIVQQRTLSLACLTTRHGSHAAAALRDGLSVHHHNREATIGAPAITAAVAPFVCGAIAFRIYELGVEAVVPLD